MTKAWQEIERLVEIDAVHRRGFRLSESDPLKHAKEEMSELESGGNELEELADVLNCLFHYAIRNDFKPYELEKMMLDKLKCRLPSAYPEPEITR